jgi:hypothetical protein
VHPVIDQRDRAVGQTQGRRSPSSVRIAKDRARSAFPVAVLADGSRAAPDARRDAGEDCLAPIRVYGSTIHALWKTCL